MTAKELEADKLFQTRPVADVRVLQAKMSTEIEHKKKHLRLMVGERYRELIDTADCVVKMLDDSNKLQSLFAIIEEGSQSYALTAKREGLPKRDKAVTASYPFAVQMKLLVDTPEEIWNALETHSYLRAGRLWQAANVIDRNFQHEETSEMKIPLTFPLVQRQWDSISHFRGKILEAAKAYVMKTSIAREKLIDSLCAVMLLERINLKQSLNVFLSMRKVALSESLSEFTKNAMAIPDLLKTTAEVLYSTMVDVYNCFVTQGTDKSLLERAIESHSQPITAAMNGASIIPKNSIYYLYSEKTNMNVIFRHLPPNIQSHVSIFNLGGAHGLVNKESLTECVESWLSTVMSEIQDRVLAILTHLSSGSQLAVLRENFLAWLVEQETKPMDAYGAEEIKHPWNEICVELLGRIYPLWNNIYRETFKAAALNVIAVSFQKLPLQVDNVLEPILKNADVALKEDQAVASFIWSHSVTNVVKDGTNVVKDGKLKPSTWIHMETPSLTKVTMAFEQQLQGITADIKDVVVAKHVNLNRRRSMSPVKSVNEAQWDPIERDADVLKAAFQSEYLKAIGEYQKRILGLLKDISGSNAKVDRIVFIARVAKAVAIKIKVMEIPRLEEEESGSTNAVRFLKNRNSAVSETMRGLEACQTALMEAHTAAMNVWIGHVGAEFEESLQLGLKREDWSSNLKVMAGWDAVPLPSEEDGSPGTNLRLPSHPSDFILHALMKVVAALNNTNGCVVEKPCLKLLLTELAKRVVTLFRTFAQTAPEIPNVSEKAYIQIYFNYTFLVKVVEGCWGYDPDLTVPEDPYLKEVKAESQAVASTLRAMIDPIDFTILSTHLTASIEKFYSRTSVLLGWLLVLNAKPAEIKKSFQVQETPSVIATVQQPPRFTLLMTSLPGAQIPASRMRTSLHSLSSSLGSNLDVAPKRSRKRRPRIPISANAPANAAHASAQKDAQSSYSIGGSMLSGMVGLVGAAASSAQMGQQSLFGGAQSMFGALMGGSHAGSKLGTPNVQ